ncbi:MAG: dihydropteroate synthase [Propioniciclava sp.]
MSKHSDPSPPVPAPALRLRGRTFDAGRPAVMAIINRTPDSFYATAGPGELDAAMAALHQAVADGADLVDVGGVRAGQVGAWVDANEEIARVVPFLQAARTAYPDLILSLDTWRSEVVEAVAGLGIDLINDTWAGHDPALVDSAAAMGAGVVVSHTGGVSPRTDPVEVSYGPDDDDVVTAVLTDLRQGAARAVAAGIATESVLVDPTLDFGKTTRHSLRLLRATGQVAGLGFPVLQAISRKDVIGETLDLPADERLEGSLAATAVAS